MYSFCCPSPHALKGVTKHENTESSTPSPPLSPPEGESEGGRLFYLRVKIGRFLRPNLDENPFCNIFTSILENKKCENFISPLLIENIFPI
jgi:hypothetical protein